MSKPGISAIAAKKLAMIGGDFMAASKEDALLIVQDVRGRRRGPPPKVIKVKKEKVPKPPKVAGEKKPRKKRVKKDAVQQEINLKVTAQIQQGAEGEPANVSVGTIVVHPSSDEAA